jgi:hypothetical protein
MNSSISRLLDNYSNARKSWETWCYLVDFECIKDNRTVVRKVESNPLLSHFRHLALKDFYIEAYKILKKNKNNADNIYALLEELKGDVNKRDAIFKCFEELNAAGDTIQQICNTRDKYYAHLDEDHQNYLAGLGIVLP